MVVKLLTRQLPVSSADGSHHYDLAKMPRPPYLPVARMHVGLLVISINPVADVRLRSGLETASTTRRGDYFFLRCSSSSG